MATTQTKLTDDILNVLAHAGHYTMDDGSKVQGQAVSFLQTQMRIAGWRNLGCLAEFENTVEQLGFTLARGRNSRGQNALVVTL